jgi:acetyl esterase/lipase
VCLTASAQQITLPLWKNGPPEPTTAKGPERDATKATDALIAGRKLQHLTDVSQPTLTVYKPDPARNSGAAVVVFPGGGYNILAYDLEGTEVCTWLNSIHVTCIVVKYRVPYDGHYPERAEDLEDAQQAMRLTRVHASEWGIDPKRVGALGFSAGAHLVAVLSNHANNESNFAAVKEHGGLGLGVNARPDFALVLYPGYLVHWPDKTDLAPEVKPSAETPPTFLLQAEDDPVHEENALVYFQALKDAKVPAELHIYAQGGHGYGLRPTELPITHWPALAETWLNTIHVLATQ